VLLVVLVHVGEEVHRVWGALVIKKALRCGRLDS
jgi:hypothetical protein